MNTKEIAHNFLNLVALGSITEAFERYVSLDFKHHNQYFKGDRKSLMVAMEEDHLNNPNDSIEIKRTYEDGQTVIVHSLVKKQKMDIAVIHVFRFEHDKIVEIWDLAQIIDASSPNENGLF